MALFLAAFFLLPSIVGFVTIAIRRPDRSSPDPVGHVLAAPAARAPTTALPLAVVVIGNHGTEITDTLPIIEMLAASGAFEVRVVAPHRIVSPFLNAGLDVAPDLGFEDYARLVGAPPALIVVPYIREWRGADAAVQRWIRERAGKTTTVLSICAGAEIVAAAGLFDGHRATANDANLDGLAARHPNTRWERDVRWVRDGTRVSSGTLAAGIDATLATIDALAGRAAVERALAATRYPHARYLDDPRAVTAGLRFGTVLEAAFRWERSRVGVVLDDGVAESAVGGMMEAYAATISVRTVAIAETLRIVRTRHGIALAPRATRAAADVDHVVELHADGFGYDLAVHEIERRLGGPTARVVAEMMNYPADHLVLEGGVPVGVTMAVRAVWIGLLGVGAVAWVLRRRARAEVSA